MERLQSACQAIVLRYCIDQELLWLSLRGRWPLSVSIFPFVTKRRWLSERCGADAASDERAASSTSSSAPEPQWEATVHQGNVYITVVAGGTDASVMNQVMQIRESRRSEGRDWYIVFHDGSAAAADAFDVVAPMPMDEVFKANKLWCVADGEQLVGNSRTKIGAYVWGQCACYERADVEIVVGEIKRPWKHSCFATVWFCHGARGDFAVFADARAYTREEGILSRRSFSVGCPAVGDEL